MRFVIINGPNLNFLGIREKEIYGDMNFEYFLAGVRSRYPDHEIEYFQSNLEGEIITLLQEHGFNCDGIILNPGGYTHTSVAIADAIRLVSAPVVEVHISNIYAREEFRHNTVTGRYVRGVIMGFGLQSYELALKSLLPG